MQGPENQGLGIKAVVFEGPSSSFSSLLSLCRMIHQEQNNINMISE